MACFILIFSLLSRLFRHLLKCCAAVIFIVAAVTLGAQAFAAQKTGWFSDVPLIAETRVDTQLSFAFDAPSGRILVLFLEPNRADVDVFKAYSQTLVAFGWVEKSGRFFKQGEKLTLEKIGAGEKPLWRLSLIPATANRLEVR